MAEISGAIAIRFATDARKALAATGLSGGASVRSLTAAELPNALDASRRAGPVRLGIDAAATAVGRALDAGYAILNALQSLRANAELATRDGLVSPDTDLRDYNSVAFAGSASATAGEGTRISRVNIQAGIARALSAIDDLAKAASQGAANLISSTSPRITVQTTRYGGAITVQPQPLDAAGLGLGNLDTLSRADAEETARRIGNAITVASERLETLESLQRNLGFSSGGFASSLPRGSLVNLVA